MKNLYLIRHAKSSWDTSADDFDRSLTDRGSRDAELVSKAAASIIPAENVVWSSTARRAMETALIFSRNIPFSFEAIDFKDDLYTFNETTLEQIIRSGADQNDNIILFGHNEAITNFVNKFGNAFIDNVPTTGFVWLCFDTDKWSSIRSGETRKVIFPRDLRS